VNRAVPRRTLFLFAHQDDEVSAAPWIVEERDRGARIVCLYLTDGGSRVDPRVRDEESRKALASLRIGPDAVAFLSGSRGRIADGALPLQSEDCLHAIQQYLKANDFEPDRIYAPSYEGGHPDHDAAHVLAIAIALERSIVAETWHFSLYHAYRCARPFFRTFRQLPAAGAGRRPAIAPATQRATTLLLRHYASQRRTWAGLLPGILIERVLLRRETVVRCDPGRLRLRPHAGELLYERMFATRYEDWAADVAPLIARVAAP
jgi:LmbE family N-acetylglucosaminyl deacetylase